MHQALKRLMAGRTTLMIAHRLSTVRGRTFGARRRRLVEQGTHEELVEKVASMRVLSP